MNEASAPTIPESVRLPEITIKSVILSILLTIILSSTDAYLGLKVGITISASIPAAIISMGILRFFKNSNVLENNIVQTAASCGECLTAGIAYTIPALILLKCWSHFNYLATTVIGLTGGILGILLVIPLRRALLHDKNLNFPEGTAIGNVLRISSQQALGLKDLILGSVVGLFIGVAQIGLKVISGAIQKWVVAGGTMIGYGCGFSPAVIAAGYIVGLPVSISILIGIIIGWGFAIPILGWYFHISTATDQIATAWSLWSHHVRYIGVGIMFISGMWTVYSLIKPMSQGIRTSLSSVKKIHHHHTTIKRTEHDISLKIVIGISLVMLIPLFFLLYSFSKQQLGMLSHHIQLMICLEGIVFILLMGIFCASICAYFAGLVGSSVSPISGLSLISIICISFLFVASLGAHLIGEVNLLSRTGAAALAIIITTTVTVIAAIGNGTMQDFKAGKMVGATPWKQQVILIIGVFASACVTPLILDLLFNAYGIGGVFPHAGMDPAQSLAAPQAGLMTAVVQGVFNHDLPWGALFSGVIIAVVAIIIDKLLKQRGEFRLYALAIGIGVYVPLEASTPIVIGGLLSYCVNNRLKNLKNQQKIDEPTLQHQLQRGLLLACGLVAGASLAGVILAIPFTITGNSDVLKIMPDRFIPVADDLGVLVIIAMCYWVYTAITKVRK